MSSSLIHCSHNKPFLNQIVMWEDKRILNNNQQWPAQGWTQKKLQSTSQSQICTKKNTKNKKLSWSLFCGLLPVWSTAAFWILVKPLLLRSMLSQSMRCTKNCNACSQQWSTERAQFFSETMPNHTLHNQCFKFWMNWAMKFCRICHTHLTSLSPTHYHFFKHLNNFLQGKFCTTSKMQKMHSKSSLNPEGWIFMLQE